MLLVVTLLFIQYVNIVQCSSYTQFLVYQTLPNLLRFNRNGQLGSSDWGKLVTFHCTGTGKNAKCAPSSINIAQLLTAQNGNNQADSDYIEGIMAYGIINIAGIVILVAFTALYILGCLVLCILKANDRCVRPTDARSRIKPRNRYIIMFTLLSIFMSCLIVIVVMGHVLGGQNIFTVISSTTTAYSTPASMVYDQSTLAKSFYISFLSSVALPTIALFNSTICSTINWSGIRSDLQSLNNSVYLLPEVYVIRGNINKLQSNINTILASINLVSLDVTHLNQTTHNVSSAAHVLLNDLATINLSINPLKKDLNDTIYYVKVLENDTILFYGNNISHSFHFYYKQNGLMNQVQHDISTIVRNDSIGRGFPDSNKFVNASASTSTSLTQLLNGNLNNKNLQELKNLNGKLQTIYYSIANLPNYTTTAYDLIIINNTINNMIAKPYGSLNQLSNSLLRTDHDIVKLPNITDIEQDVNQLFYAVDVLSLSTIRNHILNMSYYIGEVPKNLISLLSNVIQARSALKEITPPVNNLLQNQIKAFNSTIYVIPYNTDKLLSDVNSTVSTALSEANNVVSNLTSANHTVYQILTNITGYLQTINTTNTKLNNQVRILNQSEIDQNLNKLRVTNPVNMTYYNLTIAHLENALKQIHVTSSLINELHLLQQRKNILQNQLARAVAPNGYVELDGKVITQDGDYLLLAKGVCKHHTNVYCTGNSDCTSSGDSCIAQGQYRCSSNGNGSYPVQACTNDTQCKSATKYGTKASYCLADFNRTRLLQEDLLIFSDNSIFNGINQTALGYEFDQLRKYASSIQLNSLYNNLVTTNNEIKSVNTTKYKKQLNDAIASVNSVDFANIQSSLKKSKSSLNGTKFNSINSTLNQIQNIKDQAQKNIENGINVLDGTESYLYDPSKFSARLNTLSASSLTQTFTTQGMGPMILVAGQTFGLVVDDIRTIIQNVTSKVKSIDIVDKMTAYADFFDRSTGNNHRGYVGSASAGSLYYLLQLTNATYHSMVHVSDKSADLINKNSHGESYANGKYCLTSDCFDNTQTYYADSTTTTGVLSYSNIIGLLWLPVGIIFIVCMTILICPFFVDSSEIRKAPATCLLCLLITFIPFYLILGALSLPFAMVASDGCTSGLQIANNYIDAVGNNTCAMVGGHGAANQCIFNRSGVNVIVDVKSFAKKLIVVEGCSASDNKDSIYLSFNQLATGLQYKIKNETYVQLQKYSSIRSPMKSIAINAATKTGAMVYEFVDNSALEVYGCNKLSSIVSELKAPVCDDAIGAISWLAVMLYLAGWTMCCLGIPAGCAAQHHYSWEGSEILDDGDGELEGEGDVEIVNQESIESLLNDDDVEYQSVSPNGKMKKRKVAKEEKNRKVVSAAGVISEDDERVDEGNGSEKVYTVRSYSLFGNSGKVQVVEDDIRSVMSYDAKSDEALRYQPRRDVMSKDKGYQMALVKAREVIPSEHHYL